jgi:hypothetical protein
MHVERLLLVCCGYEDDGESVRVYLDGPDPEPSVSRRRGRKGPLFYLLVGEDAEDMRHYLRTYRVWQCMRLPKPLTRQRAVAAIRAGFAWHGGGGSAVYEFASTRRVADEEHRGRLRREIELTIGSVLENPMRPDELSQLHLMEDVVNTAPAGVELATAQEVVASYPDEQ